MKVELTIEKNVILKRDKPWSHFYFLNDNELLCYNEHKKFESVNSSNGKIEHISNKTIINISKTSLTHCLSNNGQLCAFLSSNYEIIIWDKDKLIRTIPSYSLAIKAIKTTPKIYISNNGEQAILILQQPYRLFLWFKSSYSQLISSKSHHKSPICSNISNHPTNEIGTWYELNLINQQFDIMNDGEHQISINCFFRSKNSSIICAFVCFDQSGFIQINRIDINWKSTIYSEQLLSYSFEILQIPIILSSLSSSLCFTCFAHSSPILAIGLSTNILLVSLTTMVFSKIIPINCSFKTLSPSHQQVFINDLKWSYDDQFIIGLTNRGALFFLNRFGSQLNLITQGECITQGPSLFVIIHPLIGKDSEATTHLGLDSFMKSIVSFSDDDKTKQQRFSLTVNANKSLIYCSDGYRLARLTYSNQIRDRRFYDPLLSLYLMDLNKQQQEHSVFIHKTRSFDEFPKAVDRIDTESIGGGGEVNISKKYGSSTSLTIDDLPELPLDDIFSAYQLLLTSSERVQHEICSCLERTTRTILLSPNNEDVLTSIQLSHCLTNLALSSTFGSLTCLRISCLTRFIPLFIDVFKQQTTVVNDPELLQLCILYIIEQWLQAVLYMPTKLNTFELYRRQKVIQYNEGEEKQEQEQDEMNFRICKGTQQLQLLQGTNINLDDFLPSSLSDRQHNFQANDSHYNRFTLLPSWYKLWLSIEKRFYLNIKNLPKYLTTMRLFIQSILHSYPSLNAIRLLPYGHQIDLNDLFPPAITSTDHPLNTKGYSTLNERRKQRRRSRHSIDMPNSARSYRRGKPPTEARKALTLHRVLYALIEQYNIRDAVCILNVALRRETSLLSSCLPVDLFSANLFQYIDTRTYFGMPGNALRSVLRTLARFMARSMITTINNEEQQQQQHQLFIYSVDSACPLPNLFKTKQKINEQLKYRMINIDRNRLNLAIQQQKMSKFWQPLKVLELFIFGQSPNEAVLFSKLVGDWRTALCLASVLPPHNGLYNTPKSTKQTSPSYSPLNTITVDALLYTKLCEYLQIDNLKSVLKHTYKQDEIMLFIKNLSSTLEQFLQCATLLQVPLTEMLLRRLNAIMIYLFTLIPIFISSKYYLPCPPIYSSILNTYDDDKYDITCKYETHIRLIYYRTIHIFIQILSASRIQLSCLKWYLDYLTITNNRRKQTTNETNDSFYSIKMLLKSLRFHKLPNIPDRILIYFRDFCIILFLLDTRDRLSLTLRNYLRHKIELTNLSDKLSWKIISYATILLSFRCLISDEMDLLRIVLNIFFDLTPSEQLMRALAKLIIARQHQDNNMDNNDEITLIINKLKAKWMQINPTYIQLYEGFLETIILQDVQGDIIQHYMNDIHDHHNQEPLFDLKPKWFETCVEYGEFMTMLIPLLLDTSSLTNMKQQELNNDHTKFDSKSIPLLQTMSTQLRELELPINLDKRYLFKQAPLFVPPHEYIVFPVRMIPYDTQQTMFQQTPTTRNNNTIGSFVNISSTQQPPGVVTLENHHRRNYFNSDSNNNTTTTNNNNGNPSMEWDGRSDDPSRSYVRQFDEPYDEAARRSIWMVGWANRDFTTTTDQTQTTNMRIPVSAQFLASSSLVSDPQHYTTIVKQHSQQMKFNNDQGENDSDLTNVTKDSEDDDGSHTQSDLPSSPRRRDISFRKNSLEESVSLPVMSNDGGGDLGRSHDFRAPSRETGIDETLTYDPRDILADYKESPGHQHRNQQRSSPISHISPSTTNGFQQQPSPHSVRQSYSDRRFLDDSDPYLALRLEQEEREKYALIGNR
ncbi:unnamed protein product [Rotaria sordida]|uniref:Uncharacterized protein n=1 Tax=Rotaria sordida TaxID=392033 RepID=A0A818UNR4_9BILA|nr:unnamed protein product [Rotaria sordida]